MTDTVAQWRTFKGDKWNRLYGSRIPDGAVVRVLKFMAGRTVIVHYNGVKMTTMLWCLRKCDIRGTDCI